jgi:hypothetical protein
MTLEDLKNAMKTGIVCPPFKWEQDTGNSIRIVDTNEKTVAEIVADDDIGSQEETTAQFICDACNHYSMTIRKRR